MADAYMDDLTDSASDSDDDFFTLMRHACAVVASEWPEHVPEYALPEMFRQEAQRVGRRSYPVNRRPKRRDKEPGPDANAEQHRSDGTTSLWSRRWLNEPLSDLQLEKFRRFFGIPKPVFDEIVERAGTVIPTSSRGYVLALKVLSFLRYIVGGISFFEVAESGCEMSETTVRHFFLMFKDVFLSQWKAELLEKPFTPEEVQKRSDLMALQGFPGAIGYGDGGCHCSQ